MKVNKVSEYIRKTNSTFERIKDNGNFNLSNIVKLLKIRDMVLTSEYQYNKHLLTEQFSPTVQEFIKMAVKLEKEMNNYQHNKE